MKKVILPLALGVTLLGIGLTNQTTSFAQGKTSPKIVQTAKNSAPAFKLKNKKGKTVSLSAYKGKKVYILSLIHILLDQGLWKKFVTLLICRA